MAVRLFLGSLLRALGLLLVRPHVIERLPRGRIDADLVGDGSELAAVGSHLRFHLVAGHHGRTRELELRARLVVEGFISGMHRSPDFGQSGEFLQHREFVHGDELCTRDLGYQRLRRVLRAGPVRSGLRGGYTWAWISRPSGPVKVRTSGSG